MKKSIIPLLLVLCPFIIYIPVIAWAFYTLEIFYLVILVYAIPFVLGYAIFLLVKKRPICAALFILLVVFTTIATPLVILLIVEFFSFYSSLSL